MIKYQKYTYGYIFDIWIEKRNKTVIFSHHEKTGVAHGSRVRGTLDQKIYVKEYLFNFKGKLLSHHFSLNSLLQNIFITHESYLSPAFS